MAAERPRYNAIMIQMKRLGSIDFTRGLVMIIMALDHTRDLMHAPSLTQSPTNLATTTPVLFLTRWITYFCAPLFVFLAGSSAYLSLKSRSDYPATRRFLLSRGLWLLVMELTVINFGLWMDIHFRTLMFQVIGTIGVGFMLLSFGLKLRVRTILVIGLLIITGHQLFSFIPFSKGSVSAAVFSPLFALNAFQITPHFLLFIAYPVIPWLGILLTGFACGKLFGYEADRRKKIFLRMGLLLVLLFVAIRLINGYGDPSRWSVQKNGVYDILSFINISKYPPSALFCLITLGALFLILSFAEGKSGRFTRVISVYGKVPFFYYLIHIYLLHLLLLIILFLQGFHAGDLSFGSFQFGRPQGVSSGVRLWVVYVIWISAVAALYPLCRAYGRYKSAHPENKWLRYL
jgi:uncharacterized membrane protein